MHKYVRRTMGALIAMSVFPLLTAGATLEEVEKQVTEAHKKMTSFTGKVEQHMSMEQMGTTMKMSSEGTIEGMNKDGKKLFRMELATKMEMAGGGHQMEGKVLTVSDGEITYVMNDMMGMKNVAKQKADANDVPWAMLKESHELKLLPDDKVDGEAVFVVEATPKDKAAEGAMRMVFYTRKDIGATVKTLMYGEGEEPASTMVLKDIKLGVEIAPERFKFEVPEGVQVMDMTGK